jgi:hypothetical protein
VGDDREFVAGEAEHARHQLRRGDEAGGHDSHCGDAKALGGDGVMQTARRATASVADAGDHGLPAAELVDDVGVGGGAVVGLGAADHLGDVAALAQQAVEVVEEPGRAFLAVGDDADGLAGEADWALAAACVACGRDSIILA